MKSLVSVCIPTYNHARVLGDALRSAVEQTYGNLEILVLDNASADDTASVVKALSSRDARLRYLRHPENIGMVRNFNACIEQAKGDYVKFLCADDALEPECVERMVQVMSAHPQVSLVSCARRMVGGDLRPMGMARYARRFLLTDGAAAIRRCFFRGNAIGEPTAVMFRRRDAAGGFDDAYRQLMDLEMWFRLLRRGAFAFLPEPLCKIRQHTNQATQNNLRSGTVLGDKRRLFHEFLIDAGQRASLAEKVLWDARMAVTVCRTRKAGHEVRPEGVAKVFFPRLFPVLTYPLASALWWLFGRTP